MGAGPGAATLLLARALPGAWITAVDTHEPYLDTIISRAAAAGLISRIGTLEQDMVGPGFMDGSLDLIWCEGAVYFVGLERALRHWRPLLRPGGRIVFSEVIWLGPDRPKDAELFWMEYPDMTDRAGVIRRIEAAGCRLISDFVQPESDWRAYLGPLGTRAAELRPGADETLRAVLDGAVQEAELFERHGDSYGYAFFIVEAAS
nr:class I SAM-dependent methyltransferase [Rubricella aquisinus]